MENKYMSRHDMLSFAYARRKYFEVPIYLETVNTNIKTPKLSFVEGEKSYYKDGTIIIGVGGFKAKDEKELIIQIKHMVEVQIQHIKSTVKRDWEAAEKLSLKSICDRISMDIMKRKARFTKKSDYERFFEDLEKMGIYLSVHTIEELVSFIAGTLEEGRVERIHTEKNPGFLDTRRVVRHLQYENKPLFPEGIEPIPYEALNPAEKLKALQKQIQALATRERYQKGFLSNYIETEFYDEVKEYIPHIAKAVMAPTCKDCMAEVVNIIDLMYDEILNAAHFKGALEQSIKEMLSQMANSPSDSEFTASAADEEEGSGDPPESLFNDSDLEVTLEDDDYDKLMEKMKDQQNGKANKDGVKIKRKHEPEPPKMPPAKNNQNQQNNSDDENGKGTQGESSNKEGKNGDKSEAMGDDNTNNQNNNSNCSDSSNMAQNATSSNGSSSSNTPEPDNDNDVDKNESENGLGAASGDKEGEDTENKNRNGRGSNSDDEPKDKDLDNNSSGVSSDESDNQDDTQKGENSMESSSTADFKKATEESISDNSCSNANSCIDDILTKALRNEESSLKRAEEFERKEEIFQKKMENFQSSPIKKMDTGDIDNEYKYNITFEELERSYVPNLSLPYYLEAKGTSLKRKVEEILNNKKSPDNRGQKSGSVDGTLIHKLIYSDTAIFKRRGDFNRTDVAGYLLLDNSGSMGFGNGSTRDYACSAFSVIEEGFKEIMPLKIVAFDALGAANVRHEVIKDFDEKADCNFSYNFCINGNSGFTNKDGYSIRVATKQLLERPEDDKLLIIASDGLPAAYTFEESGSSDVKAAVKEARKKGIKVIGMYMYEASDDDTCAKYANMYEEDFFVTNVSNIEKELTKVLKKYFKDI